MRALLVEQPGAVRVVDLPVAEPGPGEVLVRVGAAGICGSDVELLEGTRAPEYVRYPVVPGHEWAGTVAALGSGVESVRIPPGTTHRRYAAGGYWPRVSPDPPVRGERVGVQVRQIVGRRRAPE